MTTRTQERPASAASATMKAVRIHAHGGPQVLKYEDAPRPKPGAGEVLVRVHACGVNPIDWKIRAGHFKTGHAMPLVLGWDVSGTIEMLGPGPSSWGVGDHVYTRPSVGRNGGYAEYMVIHESELARKPTSLDHVRAAGIPLAGLTAWQALFDHGNLHAGQTVLIHAAAGGVGHFAVQLAKWKGAHVIATASGDNREFVMSLGAEHFVDYHHARFEDVARDVDLVIDTIGGETQLRSIDTLRMGGVLVSTLMEPPKERTALRGVWGVHFMAQTVPGQLIHLAHLVDTGVITPHIEAILPLSGARQAHEISERGHVRGKLVLRVAA